MKQLLLVFIFLFGCHMSRAQYANIVIQNTSGIPLNASYFGDDGSGSRPCAINNHTLPTGAIPSSPVTYSTASFSWIPSPPTTPPPAFFNNIEFNLPGDPGPRINLCAPLKTGFTYTLINSGTTVTVDMTSTVSGTVQIDIY